MVKVRRGCYVSVWVQGGKRRAERENYVKDVIKDGIEKR